MNNNTNSSKEYSALAKANDDMFNEFQSMFIQKEAAANNTSLNTSSSNNNHEDNRQIYKECLMNLEASDKLIQRLEDECQRKTQSIQNYKEETEKIKRQGIDEGEDIKNQAKVLRQKYTKDKNKAKILEKQCLDLEEKRSEAVARTSLYEPLLKKLGVKVDKMACKEGKPIDPTGAGGTCNVWECRGLAENS